MAARRPPKDEFNFEHLYDWVTVGGLTEGYYIRVVLLPDQEQHHWRVIAQAISVSDSPKRIYTAEMRWPNNSWRSMVGTILHAARQAALQAEAAEAP
jgi:hypothetical protein